LLLELQGDLTFTKKLVLKEHHLYGSSRLGVKTHKRVLLRKEFSISGFSESGEVVEEEVIDSFVYSVNENYFCRTLGLKQFEMVNHLGNVLATVLDRKTGVFDMGADTLMYYKADVVSAKAYYPFGKPMLSYNNTDFSYAYSFNGMERDDETGLTDFGARLYKEDYGQFLSFDPAFLSFPSESNYLFAGNSPIKFIDLKGNFKYPAGESAKYKQEYPILTKYLENQIYNDVINSPRIMSGLMKYGKFTEQQIKEALTWGNNSSIEISISNLGNSDGLCLSGQAHCHPGGVTGSFALGEEFVKQMENATEENKQASLLALVSTILHEYVHVGDFNNRQTCEQERPKSLDGILYDIGAQFEYYVWGMDIGNSSPTNKSDTNSNNTCNFDSYIEDANKVIKNSANSSVNPNTIPTSN
jgi:RHS repeat-associated protein